MRLLVFEFITGGGLTDGPLAASLLQEGYLMRNALLDDLLSIKDLELLVLQDARLSIGAIDTTIKIQYWNIAQGEDLDSVLSARQAEYDSVWLIAPETEGILAYWCGFFSSQGKHLYTSAQAAVEICQDKLATIKLLQKAGIACVKSQFFDFSVSQPYQQSVIKVNNSVGCEQVYLLRSEQDWPKVLPKLQAGKSYIIQPYISGKNLSLSCLFFQGAAYFICCNLQHIRIEQQQFVLTACTVNIENKNMQKYQQLCQAIAEAIPGLSGYAGIDFIETETGENLVLEINPRLTTSYAGIKQALGINIAEWVINLPTKPPEILRTSAAAILDGSIGNCNLDLKSVAYEVPYPSKQNRCCTRNQQVLIAIDQERANAD